MVKKLTKIEGTPVNFDVNWTNVGLGLIGAGFSNKGTDVLNKTLGMTPYEFGGMVGNMIWTDKFEDMLEAKGKKVAANVFDAGDTLGALADLYDVDDLQNIPTRDYYNAYAQAYFDGFEGNWKKLADNYYEKTKNKLPTSAIRQTQEYKDITAPYSNISRYYTIKHFQPEDMQVDTCQYTDMKNLSDFLTYRDDPVKSPLHPLSDRQFTLNTAKCPGSYQTHYNDYYVKNHPDTQVLDCYVYPDYLDQSKLFAEETEFVFSDDPAKTTSADVQFDMMNNMGKLDLAGSYRLLSRPSSYVYQPNGPKVTFHTNSRDFAKYMIDYREGNRSKTNFSDDVVYTDTYITDNDTYFYYVITIGNNITGLIAPAPYPRILLKKYTASPLTYEGFMKSTEPLDILEWTINIYQDGQLNIAGQWKVVGKPNGYYVTPRAANKSNAYCAGNPTTCPTTTQIMYVDNASNEWRLPAFKRSNNAGTRATICVGKDSNCNLEEHGDELVFGSWVGFVEATNPPRISWYDSQNSMQPVEAWEPVGMGAFVRYRYKYVQMPQNGGRACDETFDIRDGLLTERIGLDFDNLKYPLDCKASEKWFHKELDKNKMEVKKDGWSSCWVSTGCEKFATRMPQNDDEWGEYESYMCYQRDEEGKVITKKLLEMRQTDKLVAQKKGGSCNLYQFRSNFDSFSNCSVNKDCKYTAWESTGCFYYTGDTATKYNLDTAKTYQVKTRDVLEDAVNYGVQCSANVQDYVQFTECPAKPCEMSDWKTTDCFIDPTSNKAVRYKYKEVTKMGENGGVCDLPQEVLEDCDVSACKFGEWRAWSQCVKAGNEWARYSYRPLTVPSTNQVCKDLQYKYETCAPQDCKLEWSQYGTCMPYDGTNTTFKAKNVQKRVAKIIESAKYGGSCPATVEIKLC